ncbi:hypothetical protein ACRAWC_20645 [Leifsonia sp. L25]|uniref:hypothetical protein n=1 Tax=Leifsonia sp. L25 TaxID=3423957 RepID=UPI003D699B8D
MLSFPANWNDFLWPVYVLLSPENLTLQPGLSQLQGRVLHPLRHRMAGAVIAVRAGTHPVLLRPEADRRERRHQRGQGMTVRRAAAATGAVFALVAGLRRLLGGVCS